MTSSQGSPVSQAQSIGPVEPVEDDARQSESPPPDEEFDRLNTGTATVYVRSEDSEIETEIRALLKKYESVEQITITTDNVMKQNSPQESEASIETTTTDSSTAVPAAVPDHPKPTKEISVKFARVDEADDFEKQIQEVFTDVKIEYDSISHPGNLYIRGLLKSTTRDELYGFFEPFGKIISCKIIEDEFGNSKGYGFINYELKSSADEAILKLSGQEIEGNKFYVNHHISKKERHERLQLKKINYTNLYVKNIPLSTSEEQIKEVFSKFGEVESVFLPENENGDLKGYGFINFRLHEDAVKAQTELDGFEFEPGYNLSISRAERRSSETVSGMKFSRQRLNSNGNKQISPTFIGATATGTPTYILDPSRVNMVSAYAPALPVAGPQYQDSNLYVKNIPPSFGDEELHSLFSQFGTIVSAKIMTDEQNNSKGFGFVCFQKPIDASRALVDMNGVSVDDSHILAVSFAQRRENRVSYGVVHHYNQNHLQPLFNALDSYKKYQQSHQQYYGGPPPPSSSNGWYPPPPAMFPDYGSPSSGSSNEASSSPSPSSPPVAPQYYGGLPQYGMFSPAGYIPGPMMGMAQPTMYVPSQPPRRRTSSPRRRTKN
ncbi:unnamed protein product [Kuraishia capsulata CBS 1993]|uniref:RRM domain-containing protein n=1 Tax=Kuraishia capsulata CBS 1993 TaxID=1382522 RepID=W6MHL0_9ASCO|nr:uncharacterized protein KUCA_T00001739001 [Kuraishia capsulata CBS 1993]CDK25769.1 unnamed protein product [Kuraishia capsulata CBS 1993]